MLEEKRTNYMRKNQELSKQDYYAKKKISLYKTELCRSYDEEGFCKYKEKCQFAHSKLELRKAERHPRYKTELCKTFWDKGMCPYGKRCCFLHMEKEVKEPETEKNQSVDKKHMIRKPMNLHITSNLKAEFFSKNKIKEGLEHKKFFKGSKDKLVNKSENNSRDSVLSVKTVDIETSRYKAKMKHVNYVKNICLETKIKENTEVSNNSFIVCTNNNLDKKQYELSKEVEWICTCNFSSASSKSSCECINNKNLLPKVFFKIENKNKYEQEQKKYFNKQKLPYPKKELTNPLTDFVCDNQINLDDNFFNPFTEIGASINDKFQGKWGTKSLGLDKRKSQLGNCKDQWKIVGSKCKPARIIKESEVCYGRKEKIANISDQCKINESLIKIAQIIDGSEDMNVNNKMLTNKDQLKINESIVNITTSIDKSKVLHAKNEMLTNKNQSKNDESYVEFTLKTD